jgi:hypothetical protein
VTKHDVLFISKGREEMKIVLTTSTPHSVVVNKVVR